MDKSREEGRGSSLRGLNVLSVSKVKKGQKGSKVQRSNKSAGSGAVPYFEGRLKTGGTLAWE